MVAWHGGRPAAPGLVAAFASQAGVVLPGDHKALVAGHDGASLPDGACLMVPDLDRPGRMRPVGLWLLPFSQSPSRLTMTGMLDIGWRRIPGLVAFAVDEANDEFAFDLSATGRGRVVHVDRSSVDVPVVSRLADDLDGLLRIVVDDPCRAPDPAGTERWLAAMGARPADVPVAPVASTGWDEGHGAGPGGDGGRNP